MTITTKLTNTDLVTYMNPILNKVYLPVFLCNIKGNYCETIFYEVDTIVIYNNN